MDGPMSYVGAPAVAAVVTGAILYYSWPIPALQAAANKVGFETLVLPLAA